MSTPLRNPLPLPAPAPAALAPALRIAPASKQSPALPRPLAIEWELDAGALPARFAEPAGPSAPALPRAAAALLALSINADDTLSIQLRLDIPGESPKAFRTPLVDREPCAVNIRLYPEGAALAHIDAPGLARIVIARASPEAAWELLYASCALLTTTLGLKGGAFDAPRLSSVSE